MENYQDEPLRMAFEKAKRQDMQALQEAERGLLEKGVRMEFKNAAEMGTTQREGTQNTGSSTEIAEYDQIRALEEMDEAQIREEMKGRIVEQLAYQFQQGSRTVTGLSYAGIMAAVRRQGNIRVIEVDVRESGDKYIAQCRARDEYRNIEVLGFSSQSKKMRFASGGEREDEFAWTKAATKAMRNSLRKLVNETVAKVIIEEAIKLQKQKKEDAKAFV